MDGKRSGPRKTSVLFFAGMMRFLVEPLYSTRGEAAGRTANHERRPERDRIMTFEYRCVAGPTIVAVRSSKARDQAVKAFEEIMNAQPPRAGNMSASTSFTSPSRRDSCPASGSMCHRRSWSSAGRRPQPPDCRSSRPRRRSSRPASSPRTRRRPAPTTRPNSATPAGDDRQGPGCEGLSRRAGTGAQAASFMPTSKGRISTGRP